MNQHTPLLGNSGDLQPKSLEQAQRSCAVDEAVLANSLKILLDKSPGLHGLNGELKLLHRSLIIFATIPKRSGYELADVGENQLTVESRIVSAVIVAAYGVDLTEKSHQLV